MVLSEEEISSLLAAELGGAAEDGEDAIEYLAAMIADEDNENDDCLEMMESMLGELELDDVVAVGARVLAAARGDGARGGELDLDAGPVLLKAAVSMGEMGGKYDKAAASVVQMDDSSINASFVPEADFIAGQYRDLKKKKAQEAMAREVLEQQLAVEEELRMAHESAARANGIGAGTGRIGALDVGPLTLPNPGGGADLLERCKFSLTPGGRYGLIGRNGKGKSTLLRWIASRREGADSESWKGATVHYVSQEVTMDEAQEHTLPVDIVVAADVERRILMAEAADIEAQGSAGDQGRLSDVHECMEAIEVDSADRRAAELLVNLGFSAELQTRTMKQLSGGWRVRVSLAAALFAKPHVLLLDEPTNHLSIDAVLFLEKELSESPTWEERMVVAVSHDRSFLDAICTDTLHISGAARTLTQQKGNFSTWAMRRAREQEGWKKVCDARKIRRDHVMEFIDKNKNTGFANVFKQVGMKMKIVERMDEEAEAEKEALGGLVEDSELPLNLHAGGALSQPAIQLTNVGFAYPGSAHLFKNVDINVDGKSRIVLLGENGMGKTTLVKLMLGELEPSEGIVHRDRGARIALVNQHHAEQLDYDQTPLFFMAKRFPGDGSYDHEQALRGHLSGCGIDAKLQMTPARALSGGQRARVAMAAVSFSKPHVLVLDEPTNNLDLEAVEALAECVQNFDGGVVTVSHDQFFVGKVANEVCVIADGKLSRISSFEKYIQRKKAAL